ncbi:MAG: AAA family ATPase [Actinomycetota bacterium]
MAGAAGGDEPPVEVLIGRDDELARLREIADLAVEQGGQMVLASGEAGIGKSTLTRAFERQLASTGWGTHIGYCIEFADRPSPFGPVVSILRSLLLEHLDDVDAVIGHHRRDLAALLPELADPDAAGASFAGDVDRLFDAIAATLAAAAEHRPLAIIVEDIHWADAATRDLLAALVRGLDRSRVLLLTTERSGATSRSHPLRTWVAEHRRLANVHDLPLHGLRRQELAAQAHHLLDEEPDDALVDELLERTHGNPYFAHELLVARRDGDLALPISLVDFLSSRIARLDDREREILRALAVVGGVADHRMLDAMLPDLDVGPGLRTLFDGSTLEVDGNDLVFGHALLREAILRDVLPFEAEELHRRAAEVLQADPRRGNSLSDLTSLAVHWREAGDAEQSLAAASKAALAAAGVAAYEAAADMSLQALHEWPAVAEPEEAAGMTRDRLLGRAAEWLTSCYRSEEAVELLDGALGSWGRELPDAKQARLLAALAPINWHLGHPEETARVLAAAARLVGDDRSPEAAIVHHRISKQALADGQIHPALHAAERAIEIAAEHGPEVVLIEALTTKALAVGVTLDLDDGVALAREARQRALDARLVSQVANTYHTEMLIIVFRDGRTAACLDASRAGLAYAEQHCGPRWRAEFRLDLCLGLVEAGRLIEAEPLLEVLLGSELDDLRRLTVLQAAGLHALASDEPDLAAAFLDDADEIAERFQSAQETGFQSRLRAELSRRQGDLDAASDHIDQALTLQLAGDNLSYTRESIVERLRIVRAGDDPSAHLDEATALVEGFEGPGLANRAMRALMDVELAAIAGTFAHEGAGRAIELLDESGFLHEAAQARLLLLEHQIAAGAAHRDEVETGLHELHDLTTTHGMTWLTRQVVAIAEAEHVPGIGHDEPTASAEPPPRELPHHLTAREVEVMSLLADGLTNKGIGERLFVSPRTVSTHISNLLAKLGVSNRGEAAAAYHRLGLADVIDLRDAADQTPAAG